MNQRGEGCKAAILAIIAERRTSQREICKATGYAQQSVSKAVRLLRMGGANLTNLVDGRFPLGRKSSLDAKPAKAAPVQVDVVARAVRARSPLEAAWR